MNKSYRDIIRSQFIKHDFSKLFILRGLGDQSLRIIINDLYKPFSKERTSLFPRIGYIKFNKDLRYHLVYDKDHTMYAYKVKSLVKEHLDNALEEFLDSIEIEDYIKVEKLLEKNDG
jgi:hypothetical protein